MNFVKVIQIYYIYRPDGHNGEDYIEIYVYWLCYCAASCYCVASCNRYLMLINHPTDGATRGLTLRVRLLGRIKKKNC